MTISHSELPGCGGSLANAMWLLCLLFLLALSDFCKVPGSSDRGGAWESKEMREDLRSEACGGLSSSLSIFAVKAGAWLSSQVMVSLVENCPSPIFCCGARWTQRCGAPQLSKLWLTLSSIANLGGWRSKRSLRWATSSQAMLTSFEAGPGWSTPQWSLGTQQHSSLRQPRLKATTNRTSGTLQSRECEQCEPGRWGVHEAGNVILMWPWVAEAAPTPGPTEPECDDHSDPELDRNCKSLGEVDVVAAVVERKNRLHRRLVLRKGLRKIVYTQAFVRHADPVSWMWIKVSISVGMVKSLEWWWHLTRLITVYQTDLLHFSTTIQNWVSKSGFLSRCDLSDFQTPPAVCWSCRCWARSLKLLVQPSSEVRGSGWAGVDRVGTSPKIPTVFGRLVWFGSAGSIFFFWAVLFFGEKQVSTDGYLLVWGPVVSFSGILGIQTTGPQTNNKPLVEQCLEVFQTSHPICFEVFWKNAC